ncbi:MAG: ABC transporter ATP-binding protein [Gammaproteobacteria bacterium]|nr:ABC transporter ATP-binding protein [Gammaproteobacteria bacterium]
MGGPLNNADRSPDADDHRVLQVTGLSRRFCSGAHRQTVFDDLNLTAGRGEVVAILGASGSGKTTLLNLISGIDTPDTGSVRIDGIDVHAVGEPGRTLLRRRDIGFVFQFFNLIPTLTVGENVRLPMVLLDTDARQARQRAQQLLGQVGLPAVADRYPETLSGGEQQRIAVARALAHRPKILLADEPTGNLDEDTGRQVFGLLSDMARHHDATLLVVTHSPLVAAAADRVLYLRHGGIHAA